MSPKTEGRQTQQQVQGQQDASPYFTSLQQAVPLFSIAAPHSGYKLANAEPLLMHQQSPWIQQQPGSAVMIRMQNDSEQLPMAAGASASVYAGGSGSSFQQTLADHRLATGLSSGVVGSVGSGPFQQLVQFTTSTPVIGNNGLIQLPLDVGAARSDFLSLSAPLPLLMVSNAQQPTVTEYLSPAGLTLIGGARLVIPTGHAQLGPVMCMLQQTQQPAELTFLNGIGSGGVTAAMIPQVASIEPVSTLDLAAALRPSSCPHLTSAVGSTSLNVSELGNQLLQIGGAPGAAPMLQ